VRAALSCLVITRDESVHYVESNLTAKRCFLRATEYNAIARICYRPSVCPSVRHTGGSVKNGWS